MNNDFFFAAETNLNLLDIEQLEREKRKQLLAMNMEEQLLKVLMKKSNIVQSLDFDRLYKRKMWISCFVGMGLRLGNKPKR
jgi:hypothetical protein